MMRSQLRRATRSSLLAVAGVFLPLTLTSCSEVIGNRLCGADISAQIDALVGATDALEARTLDLEGRVLTACLNIAEDLNGVRPTPTGSLDQRVQSACSTASTAIQAAAASANLSYAITPPVCTVDASAQLSCEATCDVSGSCTPGTVETRCEPGDLSVVCSGTCEANATCEVTATATEVLCDGSCEGVCTGSCSGSTNAAGQCDGVCNGSCSGNCTIRPGSAGVTCGANARCRGGCSVTGSLPECRTELTPPVCDVDADCQAGCEAQGSFSATCQPATVQASGTGAATLVATLEENLPVMLEVRDGLVALGADAAGLVSAAQTVATRVSGIPACAAASVTEIVAGAQAAAAAAASVQVTVSVSVSVTASAGVSATP